MVTSGLQMDFLFFRLIEKRGFGTTFKNSKTIVICLMRVRPLTCKFVSSRISNSRYESEIGRGKKYTFLALILTKPTYLFINWLPIPNSEPLLWKRKIYNAVKVRSIKEILTGFGSSSIKSTTTNMDFEFVSSAFFVFHCRLNNSIRTCAYKSCCIRCTFLCWFQMW